MKTETKNFWYKQGKVIAHGQFDYLPDGFPPGKYKLGFSPSGPVFRPLETSNDEYFKFSEGPAVDAINDVMNFSGRTHKFREVGLAAKRSILLWGEPGTGKTATISIVMDALVEKGAACFICDGPGDMRAVASSAENFAPDMLKVVVLEDVDEWVNSGLLDVLDGATTPDNTVFLMTTNYPEELEERMTCRPGRADRVIYVGPPSEANRREYLTTMVPSVPAKDIDLWVEQTKGMTLAHLREFVAHTVCLGGDPGEVIERLNGMMKTTLKSKKLVHNEKLTNSA